MKTFKSPFAVVLSAVILLTMVGGCASPAVPMSISEGRSGQHTATSSQPSCSLQDSIVPVLPSTDIAEPSHKNTETDPLHIRIAFVGDTLLYGSVARNLDKGDHNAVADPELADFLSRMDITVANLEMSISERGEPVPDKQYTFRGNPEYLSLLSDTMGVDMVSLANNHSLDYGRDAFLDTMSHLADAGIGYAGAGANFEEASAPWVTEIQGYSVAVLAASRVIPTVDWNATDERPGLLTTYDSGNLNKAIAEAKRLYDYVTVFVHWGVERSELPEDYQVELARGYIDAGADAVIGSHPHVLQGFEIYKGKPIAYSLGNFIWVYPYLDTCVAVLNITEDDIWLEAVPCTVVDAQTSLVTDSEEFTARLASLSKLSEGFELNSEGRLVALAD